jgi:hypothetical protein
MKERNYYEIGAVRVKRTRCGPSVPDFHIPPLCGWHSVRSNAPLDAEFDSDLEKWRKAKETQVNCVSV